jgi:excisionase family DNA binding protein
MNSASEQDNGLKGYLRRHEAARYLACSVRQVDELKHNGALPYIHLGRRLIIFKMADLDAFMEKHRIAVNSK